MNVKRIVNTLFRENKPTKLEKQVRQLTINQSLRKSVNEDKINFRYPYCNELPIVVISEKAQNTIDELKRMMSMVSTKVHNTKIESPEHPTISYTTKDYPIYDMKMNFGKDKFITISKHDDLEGITPIMTFEITDKDGVQRELVRVSSQNIPEANIKKGQVIKYENRDNYFYKKDPLYPHRSFNSIEQQSAGHPLLIKRINSLITSLLSQLQK